ncbi:uncharacterized protein LOC111268057 isoform X1 [Varroa jacobsoni]|uniref:uncharacterized protein LOC111268057 isoform X1 n=1 Tax=Varroa jacobsoni TaxID=62625 RepID=UPI000BF4BACF|nr:uncharacterized protein LOC111268057 isoform X1 [Varroa jacobsoni]
MILNTAKVDRLRGVSPKNLSYVIGTLMENSKSPLPSTTFSYRSRWSSSALLSRRWINGSMETLWNTGYPGGWRPVVKRQNASDSGSASVWKGHRTTNTRQH